MSKYPNPFVDHLTIRDHFAAAHNPDPKDIQLERERDRNLNPYNDSYRPKLRSTLEIICDLKFEYADAMLKARTK